MNSALCLELADGEEMVIESAMMGFEEDPRDRALDARRQAIEGFDEASSLEAGQ